MTRDGSMHPFDQPSNVVFDDAGPQLSLEEFDPYPNVTRVIDALKASRRAN